LDGKLTTYFKLKQNFGFERYLSYESKLLRDAYICSKNVANEGKPSWFLFTEKLLRFIGIQDKFRFF
jgi:hypothetical protein